MRSKKKKRIAGILLAWILVLTTVFSGIIAVPMEETQAAETPKYRNVMYYGEWSIYAGQNYFNPEKIDGSLITHLNFAFLDMNSNGDLVLCDEHADFQVVLPEQNGMTYGDPYAGVLGALPILRSKYPNMKIGISVGGWTRSGDFSAVAADEGKRKKFAKNIAKFIDYLGYDFVDIDWEYPTAVRESDPSGNGVTVDEGCPGTEADTKNFTLFLQAIRDELDAIGKKNNKYYELSVAMSASPAMMAKVEYDKVLDIVDFANMMTYDLNGAWNSYTGHQTALYTNDTYNKETQPDGQFSVDACVQYLKNTYGDKIDMSKVVIGVAPYTRGWAEVKNDGPDADNPGLYATAKPNSIKGADGTTAGTFAYGAIEELKKQYGLEEYYDEKAQAAYYYNEEEGYFFTCDNERSVAAKGDYVKKNGLGGLISWMASLDSANSITKAMKQSLYGDAKLPAQEIVVGNPNVDVSVTAQDDTTYEITITNKETADESNTALKYAEAFKESIMYPTLYIKSKSGATFSAGSQSGTVTNENGYGVIDLSSIYAAKVIKPGTSHTFTVKVSGATADAADIEGVTMTQRIMASMSEFGSQAVYGEGVGDIPDGDDDSVGNTGTGENSGLEDDTGTGESGGVQGDTGTGESGGAEGDTETGESGGAQGDTETGGNNGSDDTQIPSDKYDAWASGVEYQLGDLITYNGKVYECIYVHTSHGGWLPDATPTLWKERTDLVITPTVPGDSDDKDDKPENNVGDGDDTGNTGSGNSYYVNSKIPQHMVTGYWHNFVNGSANLKLSDIPEYYDLICVAFTGNTSTPGEVKFELDQDLCTALGGYTKEEFIQDIKDLQTKGQEVIISVGGAEGRIEINDDTSAKLFAEGLIQIIEEYGFNGVDIDLEGSAVSGVDYIASSLKTVYNHFNDKDFIITMAPETFYIQADRLSSNDITTSYLRLACEIQDILTICYPQFYNSGGMNGYGGAIVNPGSADFLTSLSTLVIETGGLRPDQVAFGVPSTAKAAGSGYVSNDIIETAFTAMINGTSSGEFTAPKAYPTFRGVMTWSINWDATNDYAWAKAMSAAMDAVPVVDNGSTDSVEGGNQENDNEEKQDSTEEKPGNTEEENQGSTEIETPGNTDEENQGSNEIETPGNTDEENQGSTEETTGNANGENQGSTDIEKPGNTNEENQGSTEIETPGNTNGENQGSAEENPGNTNGENQGSTEETPGNTNGENQGSTEENLGNTDEENQGSTEEKPGNMDGETQGSTGEVDSGSTDKENQNAAGEGDSGSTNAGNQGTNDGDTQGNVNAGNQGIAGGNSQTSINNGAQSGTTNINQPEMINNGNQEVTALEAIDSIFDYGKFTYQVVKTTENDLVVQLMKPRKKSYAKLIIPATVRYQGKTYKVTSIAKNAFKHNNKLKSVTIGKNVVSIEENAFYGCKQLKNVTIGVNVTTIESKAFYNCKKLSSIMFKGIKLKKISSKAFGKIGDNLKIKAKNGKTYEKYKKLLLKAR